MIGMGSRPVSAMRPANTEMNDAGPLDRAPTTERTWSTVMSAVRLSWMPSAASFSARVPRWVPSVVVIGSLTYTLSPQVAISRAWRSMVSTSSANTSKEIGRSGTAASSSRAKAG